MKYSIYHPKQKENNIAVLNWQQEVDIDFTEVYTLEADNVNQVFTKCQNFNKDYAAIGNRSTSIGDIIVSHDTKEVFLIKGIGLELIEDLDSDNSIYNSFIMVNV